jgi:hypothetical protein
MMRRRRFTRKHCGMRLLMFVPLAVSAVVLVVSLSPLYGEAQNDSPPALTTYQGATTPAGFMLAATAPSKIKHDIADKKDCLKCHTPETGEKPAPKNHVGRKNESCMLCHKPAQ